MATWHPTYVESWITVLYVMEKNDEVKTGGVLTTVRTAHTPMTTKCYYVSQLSFI
jgi:hypothetical protein